MVSLADFLLSCSTFLIVLVGSYALYTCVSKKAKTAAKMGKKLRMGKGKKAMKKAGAGSSPQSKTKVHPL